VTKFIRNINMRACIVVPLFFKQRRRTFNSPEDVLDLAKYTVENYKNLDTGLPTDIVFVNNSIDEQIGTDFLQPLDGTEAFSGEFVVIEGDNIGMSYGAHNTAFKALKSHYDIWCFTEDDIIYTGKNFLSTAATQLQNNKNIGFIAATGIHPHAANSHCHAGAGVTTREKLSEVVERYGRLPHSNKVAHLTDHNEYKREQIINGEIAFTHCYVEMGYSLEMINCDARPFIRWSKSDSDLLNRHDIELWGTTESVNEGPDPLWTPEELASLK